MTRHAARAELAAIHTSKTRFLPSFLRTQESSDFKFLKAMTLDDQLRCRKNHRNDDQTRFFEILVSA